MLLVYGIPRRALIDSSVGVNLFNDYELELPMYCAVQYPHYDCFRSEMLPAISASRTDVCIHVHVPTNSAESLT